MEVCRRSSWLLLLLGVSLLAASLQGVQGEVESEGPSESECRPYIEKALKELEAGEGTDTGTAEQLESSEDIPTVEVTTDDSDHQDSDGDNDTHDDGKESTESVEGEQQDEPHSEQEETQEASSGEAKDEASAEDQDTKEDTKEDSKEDDGSDEVKGAASTEAETGDGSASVEEQQTDDASAGDSKEQGDEAPSTEEEQGKAEENVGESDSKESAETTDDTKESKEEGEQGSDEKPAESHEETEETKDESKEAVGESQEETKEDGESEEAATKEESKEETGEAETKESDSHETKEDTGDSKEESKEGDDKSVEEPESTTVAAALEEAIEGAESVEAAQSAEVADAPAAVETESKEGDSKEAEAEGKSAEEGAAESKESGEDAKGESEEGEGASDEEREPAPEEELSLDIEIPTELRPRDHVEHLLKLDDEASETEKIINRIAEITLKELKKLYENAIKPLEVLYKYRDLSNRHFGDSEIFSKPLILFMGPWSGGKSSIINYLNDVEYNETALRTGAEPSPAYFNILMYGEEPEVIDGTQLAADFTFSGLQKFGQGLEERLRGHRIPSKLLEKVNIVEIPGILEVRKQVSRVFPFNDACQWFIDRADIIFLVYDPSKLDVGPETEAILDQLKGREQQTRIILNKADQVKPEELMRVQGALIWNISPLMSSAQPPIMYTTSLWSRPYEPWAPVKLLQAQERAFLRDLRSAIDKRIENKIASARRFAVRVRNHAKMVDCYLTTYYNHKSVFGNRKLVAEQITEHPQDYHIYEGLSTLTNISRYDLPDPDVYKDFFKLNPLYDFQQLSATCTYFRGCPINRLDVAIAYDLPELVGKHRRMVESALSEANQATVPPS